jgi:putative ABC transport system permease protein
VLSEIRTRLRAIFRRRQVERELEDELSFHLERQAQAELAAGLPPEEAQRRARLLFGRLDEAKEACREVRGVALVDTIVQDLRYGVRSLRHHLGFAATAVLTLALTAGALATVFSLANALLLRRPDVEHPEELVVVSATRRQGRILAGVSYSDYARLRDQAKTLRGLAAHYSTAPLWVTIGNRSAELSGAVVSANFFPLLGVRPALGRFFAEAEDRVPGRDAVAVLSHELWRDRFGSSPGVLGTKVRINAVPFVVIGVASASFRGLGQSPNDIFIPTMMLRVGYRWCDPESVLCGPLSMIGRLAEGRSVEDARAELSALMPAAWERAPEGENSGLTVFAPRGAAQRPEPEEVRSVMLLVLVAGLLLLVGCANLAGLLVARGSARGRELAVRAALGASRMRLLRQLMTEALLLALAGAGGGLLWSIGLGRVLQARFYSVSGEGYRTTLDLAPDLRVFFATLLLSIVAAFLFGLIPALRSIGAGGVQTLKIQSLAMSARSHASRWLIGVQAAVAVGLVAVAILLAASARRMADGLNFDPSHVALMRLRPRLLEYTPARAQAFQREVVRRLESLPGVRSVSLIGTGVALRLLGGDVALPDWDAQKAIPSRYGEVGPRYFETLRTPVLRGREFDDHDRPEAPLVAVVDETLARALWPDADGLGRLILVNGRPHAVVGIVGDVPLEARSSEPRPSVYVPYWQQPGEVDARYCVRVEGDAATSLATLVREVNRIDPDVPVTEALTLSFQLAHGMLRPVRLNATFLGYAAGLALVLCAVGLYGTLAFSVSRRTREMGIRMALGAARREVFGLVLGEGMRVVALGAVAGVGLALLGARLVGHLLYGAAGGDGLTYAMAGLLVAGVGLVACWIPARRAARVEPTIALRAE